MVLVMGAGDDRLRLSDGFDDGVEFLAAAERMGLEGVVSKRRDAPYLSGPRCGWIKTKNKTWGQQGAVAAVRASLTTSRSES